MSDRRRGSRPKAGGLRKGYDPPLRARECAQLLGIGVDYVLGEIHDGRLGAETLSRPGKRPIYLIYGEHLLAYLDAHGSAGLQLRIRAYLRARSLPEHPFVPMVPPEETRP